MTDRRQQADCIFCKIVRGEIPCSKVYEDDRVLAFMDINPLAEGHVLIIPKNHYETILEMPGEEAGALLTKAPDLARAVLDGTGAEGLNVLQNNGACSGQEVGHVHVHLIPRRPGDNLGYRWNATQYAEGRMEAMRQAIVSALTSS